jgi:hypothetical protein
VPVGNSMIGGQRTRIAIDKLHVESRNVARQLASQTQARLNSKKVDTLMLLKDIFRATRRRH